MKGEENMTNGALVVFEGLDGCGKSTQLKLLEKWLKGQGYKVFLTEWHASVEIKKALTKGGQRRRMLSPVTANLVHAMDFADRYTWQILPRLKRGYIILSDRYVYTAFARGVVRGCDLPWLKAVYSFACNPAVAFYFRVTPETALERILRDRGSMKFFESGMDLGLSTDVEESFLLFQGKVMKNYDLISQDHAFVQLNGAGDINDIFSKVKGKVKEMIDSGVFPAPPVEKKKKDKK